MYMYFVFFSIRKENCQNRLIMMTWQNYSQNILVIISHVIYMVHVCITKIIYLVFISKMVQGSKGYRKVYGKKAPKTFDDGPITSQPGGQGGNKGGNPEGGYIKRITGDEREDEMDQNLT